MVCQISGILKLIATNARPFKNFKGHKPQTAHPHPPRDVCNMKKILTAKCGQRYEQMDGQPDNILRQRAKGGIGIDIFQIELFVSTTKFLINLSVILFENICQQHMG